MINVQYDQRELQVLTQLLDIAIKAGGLAVAGDVLVLHQKHMTALQAYHPEAPKNPVSTKEG